jgi:cytochrome c oxidase subunit 3
MTDLRPTRTVADVSVLPLGGFGERSVIWWGNVAFMLIEGTAFVLGAGTYLYLRSRGGPWPPLGDARPDLLWSGVFSIVLLLSMVPNLWVRGKARARNGPAIRIGVMGMALLGAILLGLRGFELAHLNVRWDKDAYGSVVWLLMVLHTSHVITDLGDTLVQGVWLCTHEIGPDQYSEIDDNCSYWSFVVLAWPPLYLLVYWLPRLS